MRACIANDRSEAVNLGDQTPGLGAEASFTVKRVSLRSASIAGDYGITR